MANVRKTVTEVRAKPFKWTPEDRARLEAMTDEEIERAARADPDAQSWTDAMLDRAATARRIRLVRQSKGLSQRQFAQRYRINVARLRDLEQGRTSPDSALLAYLTVIEREPEAVERALGAA
jgi:putative transcriptional regulator